MQILHHTDLIPGKKIDCLLDITTIKTYLERLGMGWELNSNQSQLFKHFFFENYYQTIAFVNDISWLTHFKDHPPELEICGDHCLVRYTTPSAGGLSEYDFLCASKINTLFKKYERTQA